MFLKRKQKNHFTGKQQKLLAMTIFLLVVFGFVIWAGWMTSQTNYAVAQVDIDKMRQMVLLSNSFNKIPVPVDAKTGDFYLAQERLYIPANKDEDMRLTYGYLPSNLANYGTYDLSISSDFVFTSAATKLYNVSTMDELFRAIPALQACQRGVHVIETQTPAVTNDPTLKLSETVLVGNGRTIYLYTEKDCPNLEDVVYHLRSLKAY